MKKKHLKSLSVIEKSLTSLRELTSFEKVAFETLRSSLEALPEEEVRAENEGLPLPAEIQGEPEKLALYSDGGCRGNPGPGAYAYVVQNHSGDILTEGLDFETLTTNNKMELKGPLHGLRDLADVLKEKGQDPLKTQIKVLTDSKYVVEGMKSWVKGWKARGWKKADNKAPENLEIWQELDQVQHTFQSIEWVWVKGHAGHPQNEYCDRKANEAMDSRL